MSSVMDSGAPQALAVAEYSGADITVPDAKLLFTGDFSRSGHDLVLKSADGAKLVLDSYFITDTPPSLISPEGAMLTGDVVSALAGPLFPGQYAQVGGASNAKPAIGKVESSSGSASAVRSDGTTVTLKAGDPVFQGDVILTGPASKLGISFTDGTIFSISANARMVLNSLIYDPDGSNNSMLFSLVEGNFVFSAGQIAPNGDMKIQTPVATMGIRGTAPTVNIDSETGEVNFSIIADPGDGHVGTYTLFNLSNGLPIGTVSSVGTKWQLTSANGQIIEIDKTEADLLNDANAVGQINNIYTQWQNSTQQTPQAGPDNTPPPSGGLNTNPANPDAPGAEGNTGGTGGDGQGDGQPPPQGNEQQSAAPPPPPPTNTNNNPPPPTPPPPPPVTEPTGPNFIFGTPDPDTLQGTVNADIIDGLAGDDIINALGGNDIIIVGADSGIDNIDGGEGIDTIRIKGDLDIDTRTFQSEVENIEIVDLNKTDHNTFTISADDVAGGLNDTLQFRGGGTPGDSLNLINEFIIDDDQSIDGSWQQAEPPEIRVIDGIIFDVYEFVDGQNNVLATAEVERGITTNIVFEDFENGFDANGWSVFNAVISDANSPDESSSARISTSPISQGGTQSVGAISELTGISPATLDSLADDPGGPGRVTDGGAMVTTFSGQAGQIVSFDWFFSTNDYPNFNDIAFVAIDGKVVKLFDVITSGNQAGNTTTEGWNTFSMVLGNSGDHTIAFGVLDDSDTAVETSLSIDNIRLGSGGGNPPVLGGPGNDILIGNQDDNILIGNGGSNTLTGNDGADKFVIANLGESVDLITDFGDQDTLDLTGLLEIAFDPSSDNIDDFVQATTLPNGETVIKIDLDGPGLDESPVDVAVLQNVGEFTRIDITIGDVDTFITSAAITV